jgi:pimeloyl-ACP methyl ester carboxylesterase
MPPKTKVAYRTVKIDGLDIFYRKAGPKDASVVLLLHGFPTSSHMFRNLIPALADEFRLVAPDYPGYGNSSMPTVGEFAYTFDGAVRRSGVGPGAARLPLGLDTLRRTGEDTIRQGRRGGNASGKGGQGDEIAGMVAYLASPDAGFVTGASLTIDGGYAA